MNNRCKIRSKKGTTKHDNNNNNNDDDDDDKWQNSSIIFFSLSLSRLPDSFHVQIKHFVSPVNTFLNLSLSLLAEI